MNFTKEYSDKTDFIATNSIQVNSCGYEEHNTHNYYVLRSKGRKDHHFLYVKKGLISVEINNEIVQATEGQCIAYLPNVKQLYYYLPEYSTCIYYYIHFTGIATDEAIELLGNDGVSIHTIINKTSFEETFLEIIRIHNLIDPYYTLEAKALTMRLISLLAQNSKTLSNTAQNSIINVAEYITKHYNENIDFHQYASDIFLSYSRFVHLFKKFTGYSPHNFLLMVRIDKAKEYLQFTSITISEISDIIGFSDSLYFSRLFHKYTGYSPSDYRKTFSEVQMGNQSF